MAEPITDPTPSADPTPPTGDEGKAIEDAVAKAKAEWEKEIEKRLKDAESEGARKAKLSAEQRKKRRGRQGQYTKKLRNSINCNGVLALSRTLTVRIILLWYARRDSNPLNI